MNKVTDSWYDKQANLGAIELNGKWFCMYRVEIRHGEEGFRPGVDQRPYSIKVANDFNRSNTFWLKARTIKALIRKIEKHEHKLVKV